MQALITGPRLLLLAGIVLASIPWLCALIAPPLPAPFRETQTALALVREGAAPGERQAADRPDAGAALVATPFATGVAMAEAAAPTVTATAAPTSSPPPAPTSTPTTTPTATPTSTATPQPEARVRLLEAVVSYSCPSTSKQAGRLAEGSELPLIGWQDNDEGTWLLIEDVISRPQAWLRLGQGVEARPSSFRTLLPALGCRVVS